MGSHRKAYNQLPDAKLDRLKADLEPLLGTLGSMTLPAKTLYWLVMEVIDSREEIFRLQLCETVDQIINEELEVEDFCVAGRILEKIRWPEDYLMDDLHLTPGRPVFYKPAFPCHETQDCLRPYISPSDPSPAWDGRRMPRVEE